jgi:hypothetical protein
MVPDGTQHKGIFETVKDVLDWYATLSMQYCMQIILIRANRKAGKLKGAAQIIKRICSVLLLIGVAR